MWRSTRATPTLPVVITVATATGSNVIQGLYLNGQLTGNVGTLTKTGLGTVVFGNTNLKPQHLHRHH